MRAHFCAFPVCARVCVRVWSCNPTLAWKKYLGVGSWSSWMLVLTARTLRHAPPPQLLFPLRVLPGVLVLPYLSRPPAASPALLSTPPPRLPPHHLPPKHHPHAPLSHLQGLSSSVPTPPTLCSLAPLDPDPLFWVSVEHKLI